MGMKLVAAGVRNGRGGVVMTVRGSVRGTFVAREGSFILITVTVTQIYT